MRRASRTTGLGCVTTTSCSKSCLLTGSFTRHSPAIAKVFPPAYHGKTDAATRLETPASAATEAAAAEAAAAETGAARARAARRGRHRAAGGTAHPAEVRHKEVRPEPASIRAAVPPRRLAGQTIE